MNEKKFHKKIEENLREEEKKLKAETFEEIKRKSAYSPTYSRKHTSIKWISVLASSLVFVAIISFIIIFNGDTFINHKIEVAKSTDNLGYSTSSGLYRGDAVSSKPQDTEQQPPTNNSNNETTWNSESEIGDKDSSQVAYMFTTLVYEGTIEVVDNKIYFKSSDGTIYTEIGEQTSIYYEKNHLFNSENHYHTGETLGSANSTDLTNGTKVCAEIITDVNHDFSTYKVGDIYEVRIIVD